MAKITPAEIVANYKPKLPNKLTTFVFFVLCKIFCFFRGIKFTYDFDVKEMRKRQIVLLSDHSCREQYYYTFGGFPIKRLNPVVSYQNFFKKSLLKYLIKLGAIPKYLYIPDIRCVKELISLKNKGASFLLYPEGIQSVAGVNEPINPATFKFIKKLGLDVILCHSTGSFLTNPRYSGKFSKGKCLVEYTHLFSKEEINTLSEDELRIKFLEHFRYNDFKWNEKEQNSYKGKYPVTHKINSLLYHCPKCGHDFQTVVERTSLVCKHCGNTIHIDEKYNLSPIGDSYLPYKRIDNWYFAERELVKEEIKNPDFKMEFDCVLIGLSLDKLVKNPYIDLGKGKFRLDQKGITYEGTRLGEPYSVFIPIEGIPSLSYSIRNDVELYYNNDYFSFRFDENNKVVLKLTIAVQEMHCLKDESWKQAWDEVKHEN